ncbi:hypothetical protein CHELA40_50351 [Chelatococcus asaccharovorans]|nr:hypothetical protein CHELA17_20316 [Chelatococcus asaccharovorans]CAH1692454.1 hypothetical protein CHELA40_50351 [Chelatococcus asaccharovorans]
MANLLDGQMPQREIVEPMLIIEGAGLADACLLDIYADNDLLTGRFTPIK